MRQHDHVPRARDPLPVLRRGFRVMEMGSVCDGMKKWVRKVRLDRSPSRISSTKTTPVFSSRSMGSGIRMFVCVGEWVRSEDRLNDKSRKEEDMQ